MKAVCVGTIAVFLVLQAKGVAQPILWPVESGGNGHWYEVADQAMSWTNANLEAASRTFAGQSGYLSTITTQAENAFVSGNLLNSDSFFDVWIGGFQPAGSPEPGGNWQWITQEPWDFTNWSSDEPNNLGEEDSLWMYSALNGPNYWGKWNDAPNSFFRPFVIEYAPEPAKGVFLVWFFLWRNRVALNSRPTPSRARNAPSAGCAIALPALANSNKHIER